VEKSGFQFIGPTPDSIRMMGDKVSAKDAMKEAGVPVVPGSEGALGDDPKEIIRIDASEEQIREQRENLVYHKAIARVRARQNPRTGELKDYRLLELRAFQPEVSEERLQTLFEKGAKAWAGVPDAAAWVEEMRGGPVHG
jgi:hypothetical protein